MRSADSIVSPGSAPPASLQQIFHDNAGNHPDVTIQYPDNYASDPTTPRKLYLFLNGYQSTGHASLQSTLGLSNIKNTHNALALSPLGSLDDVNERYWNATGGCCDLYGHNPNDVAYLGGLIDQVIAAGWSVDTNQIYVIGHSNGGFMAQKLAANRSDIIAAVWAHAGAAASTVDVGGSDAAYAPGHKVNILESHGTSDASISYNGGTFPTGGGPPAMGAPYPSVEGVGGSSTSPTTGGTLKQWMTADSCGTTMTQSPTLHDYDSATAGSETTVYDSDGCTGVAIEHWKMALSQHSPTWTNAAVTDALTWLEAHHK